MSGTEDIEAQPRQDTVIARAPDLQGETTDPPIGHMTGEAAIRGETPIVAVQPPGETVVVPIEP